MAKLENEVKSAGKKAKDGFWMGIGITLAGIVVGVVIARVWNPYIKPLFAKS